MTAAQSDPHRQDGSGSGGGGAGGALREALAVTLLVTLLSAAASRFLPTKAIATVIGFVFLGATAVLVWRRDDATVARFGLSLGGLVLPHSPWKRALRDGLRASLWGLAVAVIIFVPYYFGFRRYWTWRGEIALTTPFNWSALTAPIQRNEFLSHAAGQLLMIALPEEAFYRGYLQTRLDDALPKRIRVLGAPIGLSLLLTSLLFAIGHVATIPSAQRLAVFFPSLLFGWLRARTGGIGAGLLFHALCNIFSTALGHGFGIY